MTERAKLRLAIQKNQERVSSHLVSIFNGRKRDKDQIIIETLSILLNNKTVGIRFLVDVLGINGRIIQPHIDLLENCGAVKIYKLGDEKFREKIWAAYDFQRRCDMITLIKYIKAVEDGRDTFDAIKFKKLVRFQTQKPLSSGEMFILRHRSRFIEITDKGKLILMKFLRLYTFLTHDKNDLGICDNVDDLAREFMKAGNVDLDMLQKSSQELLTFIKTKDIMQLLIKQKSNK